MTERALVAVRQFQSEIDAIRNAPEPRAIRSTIHVLAAFIIVMIGILFIGHVDRVITSTSGKIVSTVPTIVVQALDTSLIKSINVREGDQVAKGQIIATLDPTFTSADVNQLRQQIAGLDAQAARAEAELQHRAPVFSVSQDADSVRSSQMQKLLFDQRAAQFTAQLNSFDQKIAQTNATIQKLQNDDDRLRQREKISKQVEDMRVTLAEKGAGSLLNQLASTDTHLELLRTIENGHNSLIESQHQMSSLKADREAFVQQWLGSISQELVTAKTTRDQAVGQLEKATKHQDLVQIVAPDDAIVLTVAKLSVGSVLKEGDPLITATPVRAPVEAEVHIASRDVGFMRAGDHATIKVEAFNFTEHGMAEGTVRWISEGAFTTDENGKDVEAFYKARIAIDKLDFVNVPATMRLIPGMTLSTDVNVGRRSLAAYLIGTVSRGLGEAMREP